MKQIIRRQTSDVNIGGIFMGSNHPVRIQSMTNTVTHKIPETVNQIKELADAGSEYVRITVNDLTAAKAVPEIVNQLRDQGYNTPIIGDFHYNGHILLTKVPKAADALAKYRINPGNVGKGDKRDDNFATMIKVAIDHNRPVRIGVNWGSIDQQLLGAHMDDNAKRSTPKPFNQIMIDTMIESAERSIDAALALGLTKNQLIVSVKMSEIQDMISAYERIAPLTDIPIHLGLTEAGTGIKGVTCSAAALGILLQQGIGDTIRVSLTPEPGLPRSREVDVCTNLLQTMGFRFFKPTVTSCPGCGRTDSDYFIHLAKDVNEHIAAKINEWRPKFPGVEALKIAVMGCVVNGPGESKYADIGISLPGLRENPAAPVYIDGELAMTLRGEGITEEFIDILENYIQKKFTQK
ncbi:MAG: flavodoxin-dependent (E)-4-hydroxy-3-methylbut-2-enyl-diphosphate synthase [Candidatus Margulisiibacteriota bacterium]|nr:flavodoxin-dependent (E)-4-hydroxy-3-methylbut-2-enyl-diphosphate synthase [Candidatus Margulisiibacteriota bacterium]